MQIHDSYFASTPTQLAIFSTILLGSSGAIYWLCRNHKLIGLLSIVHSVTTAVSIIGLAVSSLIQSLSESYKLQSILERNNLEYWRILNSISILVLLLLVAIQFVFLINVAVGLIKGKRVSNNN